MIDWKRPLRTKSHCAVRVLCIDRLGEYPVVALIEEGGQELVRTYTAEGRYTADNSSVLDLENCPEKRSGVVNVYRFDGDYIVGNIIHPDDVTASQQSRTNGFERVGSATIEFEVPANA